MIDVNRFNRFRNELNKNLKFNILYKNKSFFMKFLSVILFFNKYFMTKYITTIGNTIYFPSEKFLEENPLQSMLITGHEYMHMKDNVKYGKVFYLLMYLTPQIFAVFSLLAIFAIFNIQILFFLVFLVFLVPIPSIGRMHIELRGYKMSIYMHYLLLNEDNVSNKLKILEMSVDRINKNFTSSAYYYMWPMGVRYELKKFAKDLIDGKLDDDTGAFKEVKEAFLNSK